MRLAVAGFIMALMMIGPAMAVSDPREMMKDPAQEARAEALGAKLRCLVCQNESIEESNAPLAHELRGIVRQLILAGDTDQQIMDWMVARYSNFIRLSPPLMLSTLLLWSAPVLGLLAGGLAAYFGRRRLAAATPAPLSADEAAKLRELTGTP